MSTKEEKKNNPHKWYGCADEANKLFGDRYGVDWEYSKEENKPLTLQECKDIIAKKHGRKLWFALLCLIQEPSEINKLIDEVVELYASQFRSTTPEQWIPVSERLPEDDRQLVLFIQWHQGWKCVIEQYVSNWINVKQHREFDLKHNYTHWLPLPTPGHKIDDNEKQ